MIQEKCVRVSPKQSDRYFFFFSDAEKADKFYEEMCSCLLCGASMPNVTPVGIEVDYYGEVDDARKEYVLKHNANYDTNNEFL